VHLPTLEARDGGKQQHQPFAIAVHSSALWLSTVRCLGRNINSAFGDKHFTVTPSYFCAVLITARFGELGAALFAIALSNLALFRAADPDIRHRHRIRTFADPVCTGDLICHMAEPQRAQLHEVTWLHTRAA
jgi:hypothetical protein